MLTPVFVTQSPIITRSSVRNQRNKTLQARCHNGTMPIASYSSLNISGSVRCSEFK